MTDEGTSHTRVIATGLKQGGGDEYVDIEATAYMAAETINAAIAEGKEFVHFKLATGGSMAIKLSRILHVEEAPQSASA